MCVVLPSLCDLSNRKIYCKTHPNVLLPMAEKLNFQDGQLIVPLVDERMICVNKTFGEPFYIGLLPDGTIVQAFNKRNFDSKEFRLATPIETRYFLQKLLDAGFVWEWRWKKLLCVEDINAEYFAPLT